MSAKPLIAIPDTLNNRGHDGVYFTYTRAGVTQAVERAACYYTCMSFLPECDFLLRPTDNKSLLPHDMFLEYVRLCRDNGLITPEATAQGGEGNNQLVVPKGRDRHQVYATLCCYRWSENQPGMAYATVEAMNKCPGIDFFQAFHYGCARRVYWLHHSFHQITTTNSTYSDAAAAANGYVPYSIACAHFFRADPTTGKPLVDAAKPIQGIYSNNATCNQIDAATTKAGFPSCQSQTASKYRVSDLDMLLSPALRQLYTEPVKPEDVEKAIGKKPAAVAAAAA